MAPSSPSEAVNVSVVQVGKSLMQKQNTALCVLYAPCRKKCSSDFWHQMQFAAGKLWQQSQTGIFSCRACRLVKWRGSLRLHFYTCVY